MYAKHQNQQNRLPVWKENQRLSEENKPYLLAIVSLAKDFLKQL